LVCAAMFADGKASGNPRGSQCTPGLSSKSRGLLVAYRALLYFMVIPNSLAIPSAQMLDHSTNVSYVFGVGLLVLLLTHYHVITFYHT
jgi:hypothetical protein